MRIRRPSTRVWFESKVQELTALVRTLPRPRQLALFDQLDRPDTAHLAREDTGTHGQSPRPGAE